MAADRRSWDEWERLVRAQERSGVSLREFAAARGVNRRTLSWYRWRVRSKKRETEAAPTRFVPVVVEPELDPVHAGQVEAVLPNGVTLRFEHRLDVGGLRDLASAFGLVA